VAFAVLPGAFVLASVSPVHFALAVHDVVCEFSVVLALGGAPLVLAFAALDSIDKVALEGVSVDPGFESLAVFLVRLEMAFVSVSVRLDQYAESMLLSVYTLSLLNISVRLC